MKIIQAALQKKEYYQKNKEKILQYQKEYKAKKILERINNI